MEQKHWTLIGAADLSHRLPTPAKSRASDHVRLNLSLRSQHKKRRRFKLQPKETMLTKKPHGRQHLSTNDWLEHTLIMKIGALLELYLPTRSKNLSPRLRPTMRSEKKRRKKRNRRG